MAWRLARLLHPGSVVALYGEIGSGKTTFTKALARALGVEEDVTSPTFTMIQEYENPNGTMPFFHVDLYRVSDPAALENLGLEEYLSGPGVTAVEWAEHAAGLLSTETIRVSIAIEAEGVRSFSIENAPEVL